MRHDKNRYVPAAGFDFLTPLYDPVVRLTTREITFKRRLLEDSGLSEAHQVLDLGCGTGTLLLLARQQSRSVRLVGLDGDARVLNIAKSKAESRRETLGLVQAFSFRVPFADASFDRVLSSLMLHHLTRKEKLETFREVLRVLKPAGRFHVADWGRPHNFLMRVLSVPLRVGDRMNRTTDNVEGLLPGLMRSAGFEGASESARFSTTFGTLSLYSARRRASLTAERHAAQQGDEADVAQRP